MWLATKLGFYSVVEKEEDVFHIRARVKKDLENLRKHFEKRYRITLPEVETWPGADYRFRIITDRETAQQALFVLITEIDYSNFKSEIADTQDQRAKLSAYHRVWGEMARLQGS